MPLALICTTIFHIKGYLHLVHLGKANYILL